MIQDLLDRAANKTEVEKLKAQVAKLEAVEAWEQQDSTDDELKEVLLRDPKKKDVTNALEKYIEPFEEILGSGGRKLVERPLWPVFGNSTHAPWSCSGHQDYGGICSQVDEMLEGIKCA